MSCTETLESWHDPRLTLAPMRLLVGLQHRVHLALIAGALGPEPLQDVGVDAQGDLRLAADRLEAFADQSLSERLGWDLRKIREVDIFIPHPIEPLPVSPRERRNSFFLHFASPFLL